MYFDEIGNVIITRKAIKNLYLKIDRHGNVQISAPKSILNKDIYHFITEKKQWIINKQQTIRKTINNNPNTFILFGRKHLICRKDGSRSNIFIENDICYIESPHHSKQHEQQHIIEYYREQLIPILEKNICHYSPILGVKANEIRTKNMKTKWGSCNVRAKRLWFNVQLARFSPKHIEYVVVHELAHLIELSHNRFFYHTVEQAMPDYKIYHRELKQSY